MPSPLPSHAQALIIGGGIHDFSAVYHIAKRVGKISSCLNVNHSQATQQGIPLASRTVAGDPC